ncbi:uncharacterized protein LOC122132890 [Clupea harengus]|uniref:Uncharacterized protein LOC122132890 n=1 Tax=Clupea harengus TaxID=7950 RepID=A0A8M1KM60_CLUHA|nr:uncharacterized protein LOC122132890 [Clupea harengus]
MSSRKSKKRIGSTRQRNLGHKAEEREANEELTETITETPDEASNAGKTGVLQELSTVQHVQPLYSGEMPKCQLDVVSENIEGDQHDPGKTSTEKLETGAPAELCEAETSTSGKIRRMGSTRRTKQAFKAEERKEEEEKDNSMQIIQEEFNITRTEDQYLKEEPHAPESDQAHTHLLELGVSEVKGLTERPRDESPGEEHRLLSELDVKTEAQYTHSPPQSFDQCPTPAVNPPFCVTSPQEEGESLLKQSRFNLSEAKEISSTDTTQDTPEGLDGHYQQREDQSPEDVRESDEQRRTEEVVLEVSQEKDTNSELNVQRPKKRMGSTRRIVKGNKMIEDIGNSQEETHEMREDTLLNPELTEEDTKFRLKTVVNDKLDMVFTVNERGAQLEEAGCEFEEQENKHGNLILDENTEGTLIAMDAEAFHSTENITGDSGTMTSTSSRQLVMEGNLDHHHNEIGRKGVTEIAELNAPRLRERLGSTHEPLQGEKEVKREYGCDLTGKEIDSKDIDFQMIPGTDILAIVKSGKLQVEDIGTESFTDKPTVGSVCESFSPFENDFLASPPMVDHREEMVDNSLNLQGESFDCTKTCMSDKDAVEKAEYFTNQSEVRIPSDTFSSFEVAEHFKGAFVREDVGQLQKHDEGKAENSPESPEDQERKNSTNMAVSEQPEIENQLSSPSEDPCDNCAGTSAEVIGAIENTNILLPQSEVEILSESFDPLEQNRWSSSTPDHIPEIAVASLNVHTESSSPETYSPAIEHCDEVEQGTQAHILSSSMEPEVSNISTDISDALHNEQTKQSVSQSLTMESTDTSEKTAQYDDCESTFKLPYHTEEANVKQGASKQKRKMGSTRRTKREQKREETSEVMSTDGDYANEDINVKMNTDADIKVDAEEGILEAGIIDALKENEPSTTQTDVGILKMALSCVEQDRYVDCSPSAEVMSSSVPQCNPLEDGQKQDNQHQCLDITAQQLDGNDAANLEADNEISILGKETSEGLTTSEAEPFNEAFMSKDVDQLKKHEEEKAEKSLESLGDQNKEDSISLSASEQAVAVNRLSSPTEVHSPDCAAITVEDVRASEKTESFFCQSGVGTHGEALDPLEQEHPPSSPTPDHIPEITVASLNVRTESSSPETYNPAIEHCDEVEQGTQTHILSSTMDPEVSNISTDISDALHNEQTKQSVSQSLTMESTDTPEKTAQYDDCESTFKLPYHTEEANVKQGASKQKRKMGSTRRTKREQKREETSEVMSTDGDYANEDINVKMNTDADINVDAEEGILEADIIDALKENEPSTTQTDVGLLKMALSCVEQDRYVDCSPSAEVMSSSVPQCNPLEDGQKQDNQHQCLDITAQQLDGNDATNLEADNEISILGKETSEGLTTSEAEPFNEAFMSKDVDQLIKHEEEKAEKSLESLGDQNKEDSISLRVSEQAEAVNRLSSPTEVHSPDCAGITVEDVRASEKTESFFCQSGVGTHGEALDPLEQEHPPSSPTPDHIPEIAVASLNVRTESSSPETYNPEIQHCDEVEKGTQAHILSSSMEPEVSNISTDISDALHNEQTVQSVSQSLTMESTDTSEKTAQYDDCESTFKLPYHTEEANVKQGASKQKRKMGSTRRTKREQKREETSEVMSRDGDYANEDINIKMNTDADINIDAEEGILEAGIIDASEKTESFFCQSGVGTHSEALDPLEQEHPPSSPTPDHIPEIAVASLDVHTESSSPETYNPEIEHCDEVEQGTQAHILSSTMEPEVSNVSTDISDALHNEQTKQSVSQSLTMESTDTPEKTAQYDDCESTFKLPYHTEEANVKQGASKQKRKMGSTRRTKREQKREETSEVMSTDGDYANEDINVKMNTDADINVDAEEGILEADIIDASEKTESFFCQSGVGTHGEALDPLEQEHPPSSPTPDHIPEITVAPLNVHTESSSPETYNPEIEHCDEVEQGTHAHILSSTMDPNNGAEASELVQDGWTQQSDHCESSLRLQHHEKEGSLKQSASRQKRKMGSTRRQKRETNEVNLDEETKSSHETGEMTETEIEVQQEENIQSEQISSREKIHSAGVNTIPMSIGQIEISESSGSTAAEETSYSQLSHEDSQKEPKSMLQKRKMGSSRRGQGLGNRGKGEAEQVDEHMDDTSRQESGGALLQNEGTSKESCSGLLKNTQDLPVEGEQLLASVQSSESHLQPLAQAERPDELIDEKVPPASAQSKPSVLSVSSSPSSEFQEDSQNSPPTSESPKTDQERSDNYFDSKDELIEKEQCILASTITTTEQPLLEDIIRNDNHSAHGDTQDDKPVSSGTPPAYYLSSENILNLTPLEMSDSSEESKPQKKRIGSSRKISQRQRKTGKNESHGEEDVRDEDSDCLTNTTNQPVQLETCAIDTDNDKWTDIHQSECSEPASGLHNQPEGHPVTEMYDQSPLGQIEISESCGSTAAEETSYSQLSHDDSQKEPKSMLQKRKMGSSRRGQGLGNRGKGEAEQVDEHMDDTSRQERGDTAHGALLQNEGTSKESCSGLLKNTQDLPVEGEQLLASVQSSESHLQPLAQAERPDELIDERVPPASAQSKPSVLSVSSSPSSEFQEYGPNKDPQTSTKKRKMGSTRKNMRRQGEEDKSDLKAVHGSTQRWNDDTVWDSTISDVEDLPTGPTETATIQKMTETQGQEDTLPHDESAGHGSAGQKKSPERTRRKMGSRHGGQGYRGIGGLEESEDQPVCKHQEKDGSILQGTQENVHSEGVDEQGLSKLTFTGDEESQKVKQPNPSGARSKLDLERKYGPGDTLTSLEEAVMFNIVMVGESSVGKTSFIHQFQNGQFFDDHSATIGVDTCIQTLAVDGKLVKLQIWDTAGQERFHSLTRQVLHKADGLIVMYDISSSQTFCAVRKWISCIEEGARSEVLIMLLGNKNDSEERQVLHPEGERLAQEHNFHFMECSAATGHNVPQAMEALARLLKQTVKESDEEHVTLHKKPQQKKSGCC